MYSSALMAFLHHVAAFTVVAALAVELALFKPPLSLLQARRLLRTDNIYGTQRVRLCLMVQLTAIVVILLCAALMARGFGYLR